MLTRLLLALAFFCSGALAQSIEKVIMPGPVIQGHAKYEEECKKCHERFNRDAQAGLCADCHKTIASDIQRKAHLHGHLQDTTCRKCHTDHKGRDAAIVILDKKTFNHDTTGLALKGAHKKLIKEGKPGKESKESCSYCHLPKVKYRDAPTQCSACHQKDDVHKGGLGKKCDECHTEDKWKTGIRFNHDKTHFPLDGEHLYAPCKECHKDGHYKDTPKECYACHKTDDVEDGHNGRFSQQCAKCHTTESWVEPFFDHARDTEYRLKGKHERAECTKCHTTTLYVAPKAPTKCIACHKKDDQEKGHHGGLGEKCDSCHNELGWKKTNFDHDKTKFPLVDKHKDAKCEGCHKDGVSGPNAKLKLDKECVACHRKNDDDKGHKGRYGDKCETCHDAKAWKPSFFNHNEKTKYLLKGKHETVKCDACHLPEKGQIYKNKLESTCIACHKKDDKHKGQLGNKCETCHDEKKWTGVEYDHNKSRFPLTGSHMKAECKKCHLTPAFRDAPRLCNGCHEKEDKHKGRFGTKCESCHYTGTWKSWDFDHSKTRYPLDGAHKKVDCYACHKETLPDPVKPGRLCISCHDRDDVHDGGFSVQCERCHVTSSWKKVRR